MAEIELFTSEDNSHFPTFSPKEQDTQVNNAALQLKSSDEMAFSADLYRQSAPPILVG